MPWFKYTVFLQKCQCKKEAIAPGNGLFRFYSFLIPLPKRKRRSELPTTNSEERLMAAADTPGISEIPRGRSAPAAAGMQIEL